MSAVGRLEDARDISLRQTRCDLSPLSPIVRQSACAGSNTKLRLFCSVTWHASAASVAVLVQVLLPLVTRTE